MTTHQIIATPYVGIHIVRVDVAAIPGTSGPGVAYTVRFDDPTLRAKWNPDHYSRQDLALEFARRVHETEVAA